MKAFKMNKFILKYKRMLLFESYINQIILYFSLSRFLKWKFSPLVESVFVGVSFLTWAEIFSIVPTTISQSRYYKLAFAAQSGLCKTAKLLAKNIWL